MAGCTAVSIALSTVFLAAGSRSPAGDLWSVPVYVFSTQTIALAVLLAGFRHVMRLPADIPANRLFRLAWVADSSRFLAGVRRGAFVGIVLPAIVLLLPPYLYRAGHAARVDARALRVPSGRRAHIPDDVQDEPAAVRRQLRSGIRPEHGRTGRPDRRIDRRVDIRADRAVRAGRHRISRDPLEHHRLRPCSRTLAVGRNTQLDLPTAFDVPPRDDATGFGVRVGTVRQSAVANSPRRHKG